MCIIVATSTFLYAHTVKELIACENHSVVLIEILLSQMTHAIEICEFPKYLSLIAVTISHHIHYCVCVFESEIAFGLYLVKMNFSPFSRCLDN